MPLKSSVMILTRAENRTVLITLFFFFIKGFIHWQQFMLTVIAILKTNAKYRFS